MNKLLVSIATAFIVLGGSAAWAQSTSDKPITSAAVTGPAKPAVVVSPVIPEDLTRTNTADLKKIMLNQHEPNLPMFSMFGLIF